MNRAAATALAEQISGALTEACLTWGEAINRAESAKGTPSYPELAKLAQLCGVEVATLSAEIAKRLRP